MTEINEALSANDDIKKDCAGRIKFYKYPESANKSLPFIVITPTKPPYPAAHGSNNNGGFYYEYQLTVESRERLVTTKLAEEIRKTMKSIGFGQQQGGLSDYFDETKRYVDSRFYLAYISN